MTVAQLSAAIKGVNWSGSVASFTAESASLERLDSACTRLAVWAAQLELADKGNPALSFVRAAQASAHHVVATCALALYRASAASIRSIVENGLYYTYFRTHPVELSTLVRDSAYYVTRSDLIAFHKTHTPEFKTLQDKLGYVGRLETWYSQISAIVHGQIPGTWVEHGSLEGIKFHAGTLAIVADQMKSAEQLLHELLLLTVGRELWDKFSSPSKKTLLSGVAGEIKTALKLDKA